MNKTISITLPTRCRPERVRKMMSSCVDLADHPERLEFLLYLDPDDTDTRHETLQEEYPDSKVKVFIEGRLFSIFRMQNFLTQHATGDIIGYLADDMHFTTEHWDTYVQEAFTGDRIWLVYPIERHKGSRGATHGFLSRVAIELVGALMPNDFYYNYGDTWLWDVYGQIGRLRCLKTARISHDHPGFAERRKDPDLAMAAYWDDTYAEKFKRKKKGRMNRIEKDKKHYSKTAYQRQQWVNKLTNYIRSRAPFMRRKEELIEFENEIKDSFLNGDIQAPVHLSDGNEEMLIDLFSQVKPTDWVFSAWRSHYHALLHGVDPDWLKDQILRGFSITICNPEHRFYASAIVGGILPIALGAAMGIKRNNEPDHVWVFIGDMTYRTGICHECISYAAGHALPISFIVEDNGIAVQTPTEIVWGQDKIEPDVYIYKFNSSYPHVGAGQWVTF